jgi:hypothetical protein
MIWGFKMALADLTELEILEGSLGLVWVLIAIVIGVRVISKAISLGRTHDLITVGLSYIFVSSAWWGVAAQFVSFGFFNVRLDAFSYLLIANIFIPFAMVCWIWSYCQIIEPKKKMGIMIIYTIFSVIWEIYVIVGLFTDIALVGTLNGIFDSSHNRFLLIIILVGVFSFLITGVHFAYKSMRLEDPEIQWKGRFLLIAWVSFALGALLDAALPLNTLTLIIVRIILISSAIEFYFGFFLPKKMAKKLG